MSQISLKSISGITSITTPAGVDNQFTLHTNNTSQALKLDSAGNIHIHNHLNTTGVSTASNFKTGTSNLHSAGLNAAYVDVDDFVDVGSNIQLGNAGVVTATSFVGSGANLTGITQTTINNNANNRIITGSGTANTLEGEANLTFDGANQLKMTGSGQQDLVIGSTNAGGTYLILDGDSNGDASGSDYAYIAHDTGGDVIIGADNPSGDAAIIFKAGNNAEKLRIDSAGNLSLGKGSAANASYGRNFQIHHDGTSGAALQLTDNNTGSGGPDGFHIISTSQIAYLWQRENANMVFGTQGIARWNMYGSNGHFAPHADSTYDIGTNTVRVRNIYADNLYGSGANLTSLPSSTPPNNFLINGAMQVNVRGTDHQVAGSFNPVTGGPYTLDRWKVLNSNSFDTDSAKVVQDNVAPTSEGFRKSIMMNIGNTETPSSTQVCGFQQKIEAQNLQSLAYGTSSAKTMTLSFWVYSNKTGTYCVQIMQDDVNKYVLYEYTISSSNTWEKKTITIAGNTADAINNDNGIGLEVNWILCVGSGRQASATSSWTSGGYYVATSNQVNLWDHADNYFKMTGCQLQTGSTATDFVHEDYGTTLRKCQRYFFALCGPVRYETIGTGMIYYSGTGYANAFFPVSMRTQPSLVALSGTSGAYMYQTLLSNTAAYTHQIGIDAGKTTLQSATLTCACPSTRNGEAFRLSAHFAHPSNNGQSFVNFDAEL